MMRREEIETADSIFQKHKKALNARMNELLKSDGPETENAARLEAEMAGLESAHVKLVESQTAAGARILDLTSAKEKLRDEEQRDELMMINRMDAIHVNELEGKAATAEEKEIMAIWETNYAHLATTSSNERVRLSNELDKQIRYVCVCVCFCV
jgi:hypothetical protein